MRPTPSAPLAAGLALAMLAGAVLVAFRTPGETVAVPPKSSPLEDAYSPDVWRKERRIIDLHQHVGGTPAQFDRAVRIMDAAGVGIGVNSAGTVTRKDGRAVGVRAVKAMADRRHPGRFVHYMNLDYAGWDDPDSAQRAVGQIEEGHRLGAAGLKEYKRLGLFLQATARAS